MVRMHSWHQWCTPLQRQFQHRTVSVCFSMHGHAWWNIWGLRRNLVMATGWHSNCHWKTGMHNVSAIIHAYPCMSTHVIHVMHENHVYETKACIHNLTGWLLELMMQLHRNPNLVLRQLSVHQCRWFSCNLAANKRRHHQCKGFPTYLTKQDQTAKWQA